MPTFKNMKIAIKNMKMKITISAYGDEQMMTDNR